MTETIGLRVFFDVRVVKPNLALLDARKGIADLRFAGAEGLYFRAVENNAGLADSKLKAQFADLGSVPSPTTPAEFGKFIADKTEKWTKVILVANIKPE